MDEPDPQHHHSHHPSQSHHYAYYQDHNASNSHTPYNPSELNISLINDDPDAFYRPVSTRTNLPDIFLPEEVQPQHKMPPKKKSTIHLNGNTPKPPANNSTSTLPRVAYRSVSSPASSIPTPTSRPSSIPTRPGIIKERVKQLEQNNASRSNPPSSSSAKTPNRRDAQSRNGTATTPSRLKKRPIQKPPLFGEVLKADTGAGYGIPSLTKQRSNLETSLPRIVSPAHSRKSSSHGRSRSDETDIDSSPIESSHLAPSRIPVRRARRASDLGPNATNLPSPALSDRSNNSYQNSRSKPNSPAKLSTRRYDPNRTIEASSSLTAVIKEPPPKLSPTLRSSRPRQPVSAASTASSRARITDRYTKHAGDAPKSRTLPRDYVHVDIAQRRDQVHSGLSRSYLGRPSMPGEFPISPGVSPAISPEPRTPIDEPLSPEGAQAGADQHFAMDHDFEFRSEDVSPSVEERLPEPAMVEFTQSPEKTLLQHILSLRDSHDGETREIKIPEDLLTDAGDGETIQMFLGQTPQLPQEHFSPPQPPPIPEEDEYSFMDNRASLYPDDSVSVIFSRRMEENTKPPPMPFSQENENPTYTIDSAARSQINRVLEQYQDEMSAEPAAHAYSPPEELTPNMAMNIKWDSIEETKQQRDVMDQIQREQEPAYYHDTPQEHQEPQDLQEEGRRRSIEDDLLDEEYRGTAIIYTNGRSNALSPVKSKTSSITTSPSKIWHNLRSPVKSQTTNDSSRAPPLTIPSQPDSIESKAGLGVFMNASPEMPTSPIPHSHSAPPLPSNPPPLLHRLDTAVIPPRQGSWGLPSSPAPKNRPRRETLEDKDPANRESKSSSKRSLTILNPAYTPSTEATTDLTGRSSINTVLDEKEQQTLKEEKQLNQRWNFLKELIDTEHTYYHDMTIGVDIFLATAPAVPTLTFEDRRLIFGNIEKIRDLASKLLDNLKKSVNTVYRVPPENRFQFKRGASVDTGRDSSSAPSMGFKPEKDHHATQDLQTTVGYTFCLLAPEMDRLFKNWMIHSEKSNRRIQQVKKDPQVKLWLDECYENAKDITNAWDLDSLLIKPAQRYMKYPLLLNGILSCTPPTHPDHDGLVKALKLIEESVTGINEEKRRREVANHILTQKAPKRDISRLNLKKLGFMGNKGQKTYPSKPSISQPISSALSPDVDGYEVVRQKFGGHFFQLQIVMRDFEKYLEDLRHYVARVLSYAQSLESTYRIDIVSRFPEQESRIHHFVESVMSIQKHALPDHMNAVEKFVVAPVRKLWHLHDKPQVLMLKHRKLKPQYERYEKEKDKEKVNDKLKLEAEQWVALNQLLKDELPQLYDLTGSIVQACLQNFLEIQNRWDTMWMAKLKPFIDAHDIDFIYEYDYDDFTKLVEDEFFHDFDNTELDCSSLALTSGNLLQALAAAEQGKEIRWIRSDQASGDGSDRPRTGRTTGTNHSARGSVEHANRSTPNLNMNITSPNPSTTPNRRSYNNSLSPAFPGAYPGQDGYSNGYFHGITSAPVSGGATPNHMSSPGQTTPAKKQFFHSDWAESNEPGDLSLPKSFSDAERDRVARGLDGISLSHHQHASEQLSQKYPQVSHYDQIMASQSYHSRHHSNSLSHSASQPQSTTHLTTPTPDLYAGMPSPRYSGIFHSALPADMADDSAELMPSNTSEPRVLFIVASLFEFHIDSNRREAGYPYLKYVAGEIFEIVGQRGELWLARNQDDGDGTLGWIWEKHFALLPTEPQ